MVDFATITMRTPKKDLVEVYPKFIVNNKSSDLMIRGSDFYAVWLQDEGKWSTDEGDVIKIIDKELERFVSEHKDILGNSYTVKYMWDADSGVIDKWHRYCQKQMRDCFHPLDEKLVFSNDEVNKKDYSSKRLPYPKEKTNTEAYDELLGTLYLPEEREKIEWAIGSIIAGASVNIQKFLVLYGEQGAGKGTVLKIVGMLFDGYCASFEAKILGQAANQFALEAFRDNPLVAIDYDGDLSHIEDNTRLNRIVSHEPINVNEKFKSTYESKFKTFLFMGSNKPVKITDAKSGILRRLIDVKPSGKKVPKSRYDKLIEQVKFELGGIAIKCEQVYLSDPTKYDNYQPLLMMEETNDFYDFMLDNYLVFSEQDSTTLKAAWEMYKTYIDEAHVPYPLKKTAFKQELSNYFQIFDDRVHTDDGTRTRSVYRGFRVDKFVKNKPREHVDKEYHLKLVFKEQASIFDEIAADWPAQYGTKDETPRSAWENVHTTLKDLDTHKLHFVYFPEEHKTYIVVDFDLKDEEGNKSLEKNIEAASLWPPTYAELSKSGAGIHLHYIWTGGDLDDLAVQYAPGIEIKVYSGNSSLRRKLTKCNDLPIAPLNSGLPKKEKKGGKDGVNYEEIKNEAQLRRRIIKTLNREYDIPSTKSCIDFIVHLFDEAYEAGYPYDLTNMRSDIFAFAANSTNQSKYCVNMIEHMKFKSKDILDAPKAEPPAYDEAPIVIFDIEVVPNLVLVCWKIAGEGSVVRMYNPSPEEIEQISRNRLVGYNCKHYDNHVCYARMIGYSVPECYQVSHDIIKTPRDDEENDQQKKAFFKNAWDFSYTDIMDYYGDKYKSLKKWEIELDLPHEEFNWDWDQPLPEELWEKLGDYCEKDVLATEAVWFETQKQFRARQILAELAGGKPNDSTNSLTIKIISKGAKKVPLVYTDMTTGMGTDGIFRENNKFERYEFVNNKNIYHADDGDIDVGFGGWNHGKPGIYRRVKTFDVSGEHPASIDALRLFDTMTDNYTELVNLRRAIKHKDFEKAKGMMDGKVARYLDDEKMAKELSDALKIAVNSVYGLTAAGFENALRDERNVNNIVALRGALFMIVLKGEIEKKGFTVISCKTDSCKVVKPTPELEKFIFEFGKFYGYDFEVENVFEKICLVNVSTFIAKCAQDDPDPDMRGKWYPKAKQFAVPYVFKTLFSHEDLEFNDICEVFNVKQGTIYIDMNEDLPDVTKQEKELAKAKSDFAKGKISDTTYEDICKRLEPEIAKGHNYLFIGKVGKFCPIKEGKGGGVLYRMKDGKYYAVQGTSGYRWLEANTVKALGKQDDIDYGYFDRLAEDAKAAIEEYGSFEKFVSDEPDDDFMNIPDGLDGDEMPFEL